MIIFGIDPGTATTGYGVIKSDSDKHKNGFEFIEFGCITTPKEHEMPLRLFSIQTELNKLLVQHKPDCVVVEQLFFGVNSRTAMTVGQARGIILAAAAGNKIPVFEYQGLHVKNVLTGSGKSDKKEIQKSVLKYLNKHEFSKPLSFGLGKGFLDDAADALAVAICHVIKSNDAGLMTKGEKKAKGIEVSKVSKVTKVSKGTKVQSKKAKSRNDQTLRVKVAP
ncbi:MAG TPA: crossover junction endodeoxyribonuclease RuvC [Candidatus Saccharimonadales bacterium]|nr:crossover junction endodeoxyribonuclease RuvC [Candidatus Saccharimonadales bacterium]